MNIIATILVSLVILGALWRFLSHDKLDWLRGLLLPLLTTILVIAAVFAFGLLIRESLAPSYPPAPDYTGQDQSGAIGGGWGNSATGDQ